MLVYKSTPFFLKNNAPGCNYLNIVIPPHQVGGQVGATVTVDLQSAVSEYQGL